MIATTSRTVLESKIAPANASSNGLFVFTRFPQPGRTKTRLIPALGDRGAADVQRQMTEHLLERFQDFSRRSLSLQIHFTGGTLAQMSGWLGSKFPTVQQLISQRQGSLGERLVAALDHGFSSGLRKIIVVGSDCPQLDSQKIVEALTLLDAHDVVLGPALDGGYYLIGLNRLCPFLFENIPWSTERVLAETEAIALHHALSIARLSPLSDIDRPEDLPLWYDVKRAHSSTVSSNHPQTRL